MLRKVKTVLLMVAAIVLFTLPCYGFDKPDEINKEEFEEVFTENWKSCFTYTKITAIGTAKVMYPEFAENELDIVGWPVTEVFWQKSGSGTVMAPGWVMTAAHVVVPDVVEVAHVDVGTFVTKPIEITDTKILVFDYKKAPTLGELKYVDHERDIALVKYHHRGFLIPTPYDINTERWKLNKGDAIAVIVHQRDKDDFSMNHKIQVRWGTIMKAGPMGANDEFQAWLSIYDFTIDAPLWPGDSGSLVVAFDNGKPVIIGVARARYFDGFISMSYAAWVGDIVERMLPDPGEEPPSYAIKDEEDFQDYDKDLEPYA